MLIECPACGTEVSSRAEACPKCGDPSASAPPPGNPAKEDYAKAAYGLLVLSLFSFCCVAPVLGSQCDAAEEEGAATERRAADARLHGGCGKKPEHFDFVTGLLYPDDEGERGALDVKSCGEPSLEGGACWVAACRWSYRDEAGVVRARLGRVSYSNGRAEVLAD